MHKKITSNVGGVRSGDLNLKFWMPSITFEWIKIRTPNLCGLIHCLKPFLRISEFDPYRDVVLVT